MTALERAAKAAWESDQSRYRLTTPWEDLSHARRLGKIQDMRAALAAVREPSEATCDAGGTCNAYEIDNDGICTVFPAVIWRAMIDAILSEAAEGPKDREP